MAESGQVEFEDAVLRVRLKAEQAIAESLRELGRNYDHNAVARQASSSLDASVREILMYGADLWPCIDDDNKATTTSDGNVIPFVRKIESNGRAALAQTVGGVAAASKVAGSAVGMVLSVMLVVAAFTDSVEFPGLRKVATLIYSHNPDRELIRYVSRNGRFMRVEAMHRAGDPNNMLHVVSVTPVSSDVAHGLVPFDGEPEFAASDPSLLLDATRG